MATAKKKTEGIRVAGKIWLERGGVKFYGPGPHELLAKIAETGSLHIAAAEMGISYRKAWVIVDRLNKVMGVPMVVTQKGGAKGGGSTLSAEAADLMKRYSSLAKDFGAYLDQRTSKI